MAKKKNDDVKLLEKALKAGMDLISLGEEKLGKLANDLAKKGEKYADTGKSPISSLIETLSETRDAIKGTGVGVGKAIKGTGEAIKDKGIEMGRSIKGTSGKVRDKIEEEVSSALQKINFATKADLDKLRAEVEKLKKKIPKKKPAKKKKAAKKKE